MKSFGSIVLLISLVVLVWCMKNFTHYPNTAAVLGMVFLFIGSAGLWASQQK